ncbi:zinc-ribbon and DUF3426 domain-containing protein [Amphritea sp. 1_MG-2023]|uniref:zinc-ribbon and DUF3426 domain-containing protein n=1 Tax=Amphritea sp. 1_MG-2023 TaxID=3062670 RepID=UPI0026E1344C|nr:zinc-ribbon and DUF3426 domain-containing protein [Amphritea sp. 1_MG-2023]MDO6564417.1 zinc-ribbon and DUF3426 domain-containing protein [Amphritea sp. 1_MG-2023]
MSHNTITECPTCATRFKVTPGQLKIAHGKVRCGECLEVFNAEVYRCDHLSDPLEELIQASLLDPADDDVSQAMDTAELPIHRPDNAAMNDDHIAAEALHHHALIGPQLEPFATSTFTSSASSSPATQSAPDADDALETPLNSSVTIRLPMNVDEPLTVKKATADTVATKTLAQPVPATPVTPAATAAAFNGFRAEPIFINHQLNKSSAWRGWTVLSLIAALLLAGQYLWFNRQQLSAHPALSSIYQTACQQLPCQLDTAIMLDQIHTLKFVVRPHPEYQGALIVNLLLENQAHTSQPFPAIRLSFSDRLGHLISQRAFQPNDYLNTSQATHMMPVNMTPRHPVQIEFEILDPGRRALSYEVTLQEPLPHNATRP